MKRDWEDHVIYSGICSFDLINYFTFVSLIIYRDPAVSHALKIRQALQQDNYYRFFKLYRETPNMGTYILDLMLDNWRVLSLQKMCKGYKPEVPATYVMEQLAFTDPAIGEDFMRKVGCILVKDKSTGTLVWNTKDSTVDLSALLTQAKLLL